MKSVRWLAAFAVAGTVLAAPVLAKARELTLGYDVYLGGLKAVALDITLDLTPGRYDMSVQMHTDGWLGRLASWSMDAESRGRLDAAALRPSEAVARTRWNGKERWRRYLYDDGVVRSEAGPKRERGPARADDAERVPGRLRKDALDLASGIVWLSATMDRGADCAQRVPIYDGKRRYDFVLDRVDRVKLSKSRYSIYEGPAETCRVALEPVYGKLGDGLLSLADDTADIWIGRVFATAPPVPVRFSVGTTVGTLVMHLKRAALSDGGAQQALRQAR